MEKQRDFASFGSWLGKSWRCECGQEHHIPVEEIRIEAAALERIPTFCLERQFGHVLVVADRTTYAAAGEKVCELLKRAGIQAAVSLLPESAWGDVVADEASVMRVLLDFEPRLQAVLAVGSGTIHDVVRFVCHRTGRAFVSVPTAPSVDGFVSVGAPLVIGGFKQTIPACAPLAMFADLDVLAAAPPAMAAAGFGDMLGKFTSLADWQLGRVLLDEHYCPAAADMTKHGLRKCLEQVDAIRAREREGIAALMEGLTWSGIAMLTVGHSRPASGAEHHLSHFWEMNYLLQGKKALLHGAKVGAAAVMMAEQYARAAAMTDEQAAAALDRRGLPNAEDERRAIRQAYGAIADQVIRENKLDREGAEVSGEPAAERLKRSWEQVRRIAADVPSPHQMAAWLEAAGGSATPAALGIGAELVDSSLACAHYVRNRYTILRLNRRLN
jgi:glycerol-1-phosphate dehydrogenase [NAD(P)+]